MIKITKNQIPEYLKNSGFYNGLNINQSSDDEPFEIPKEYYRQELEINNFDDLVSCIKICDFWLVNKIPDLIYDSIFLNKNKINLDLLIDYFPNIQLIKEINNYQSTTEPMLFQILNTPVSLCQKNIMLKTYTGLILSRTPEKKLKTWFEALMTIPFGKFKGINLKEIKSKKVKNFLDNLQTVMDQAVYGHDEAKRHILQMMGQQVRNPNSKGNMLGIWGPPGNGKTTIIKEGIAKAMDKPFIFISLGGATDSSFLEGHSYTYEGSIYGRIADGLITSKCMDPIIYFDELDKISKTPKGDEISNILVHLTDPVQNTHFRDKYFHGIDIDLSKATMIFSFNDPYNVNPILMDRITTVETKYLLLPQKIYNTRYKR
jgi:hypothetical protein